MPLKRLTDFLETNDISFATTRHAPAYTAQEVAAAAHVPGQELAKTVMVKLDGRLAMAVVPSTDRIDFDRLASEAGSSGVSLADEAEFAGLFPDCEVGAMPPFGNLWDVPVYVSESLAEDDHISFNAGTHTEVMTVDFEDFNELVGPRILEFSHR